jgi:hypothetical protein
MTSSTPTEQKRLDIGLRAWLWGTGIQLAFTSAFAIVQIVFLVFLNAQWLTGEKTRAFIGAFSIIAMARLFALIAAWGCKVYASARLIRTIGDQSLNMSTLIGRLLMVVGATPLLYCIMVQAVDVINADASQPRTVNWAWTLPVPFGAVFLIGAACLAIPLARRAGQFNTGLALAGLFLLGILPDVLTTLALHAQASRAPGSEMPFFYRFIAAFSPVILALVIACEFYAITQLRKLANQAGSQIVAPSV